MIYHFLNLREEYRLYEASPPRYRKVVDEAYECTVAALKGAGLHPVADMRREELLAAISHYVRGCWKDEPEKQHACMAHFTTGCEQCETLSES